MVDLDIILGFTKGMHECMSILAKTAQKKKHQLEAESAKGQCCQEHAVCETNPQLWSREEDKIMSSPLLPAAETPQRPESVGG